MLPEAPTITGELQGLIDCGLQFATVYADPPWSYTNKAARGAADNHYPTMSVNDICAEPVSSLVCQNAHLHLWTTNAFLYDAFHVIEAWGFTFKSCLVWIKPQLGMGNYWRVSHEFLLLGVRGSLPFTDKTRRSWFMHRRSQHSKKPYAIRHLIEQVSPGPYLEMYGRVEQPNTGWTVYGNQIERRLF